ncbi:MAG: hypothetical protein K1X78_24705 [Verrucomicrobiaceae bacterium]|nr:hypothetical protein [Verrucomicrobiaceae bacterium]
MISDELWRKHHARHAAAHVAKLAGGVDAQPVPVTHSSIGGAGTELRKMLGSIGIHPRGEKCKCNEHAREMDRYGPDWCEANIETILDWLEGEAKSRPLVGFLFSRYLARKVVIEAIARARAALTSAAVG